ncbi:hypothetical protein LRY65_04990 [Candidatus Woesebacteria bacterium]|nr:hypothetical protein [Candidatus Woesebacteria bacterium]MCD8506855.1 hypothetical protein [Candidatus Woesebacteria bacterium]MCD8527525.1 hypothetical protein [Candidatus Woesebacteria bacterium]MCD8546265.1 hypothetical protein [Candidatus Woesebacteria bacterium]
MTLFGLSSDQLWHLAAQATPFVLTGGLILYGLYEIHFKESDKKHTTKKQEK